MASENKAPPPWGVLYQPPNPDGSRKKCGNCVFWVRGDPGKCVIHEKSIDVYKDHICGYYVYGRPKSEWVGLEEIEPVKPKYSGLERILGGTSCDTCKAFDNGSCHMVYVEGNPAKVDAKACCARWTPKEVKKSMLTFKKFKKSHKLSRYTTFQGMKISIETDKGEYRHWHDPNTGESGKTKFKYPYGYVTRGKEGLDGDKVDCFVGPNEGVDTVYVIHQRKTPDFKEWDEDKVMLGFESKKDAKQAYLSHFNDDRFFGSMDVMSVDRFKESFVNKSLDQNYALEDDKPPQGTEENDPSMSSPGLDELEVPQDPFDVTNLQNVQMLLQNIEGMKDEELLQLGQVIWGEGYEYRPVSENQIRAEITGFLLDQADMLSVIQPPTVSELPRQETEMQSSGSDLSQTSDTEENLSQEQNSGEEESQKEESESFKSMEFFAKLDLGNMK